MSGLSFCEACGCLEGESGGVPRLCPCYQRDAIEQYRYRRCLKNYTRNHPPRNYEPDDFDPSDAA